MTRSLLFLWLALLAAVVAIAVLAQFWVHQRQQTASQRVRDVFRNNLEPRNEAIAAVIANYSRRLQQEFGRTDLAELNSCVEFTRSPLVQALVVVREDSRLFFPEQPSRESTDRQTLIDEALQLLQEQADPRPQSSPQQLQTANLPSKSNESFRSRSYLGADNVAQSLSIPSQSALPTKSNESARSTPDKQFGWITWYHRRGMVLGFWWHQTADHRAIAVLPRARWQADIVAALPDTKPTGSKLSKGSSPEPSQEAVQTEQFQDYSTGTLHQLVDVEGTVIYQWGTSPEATWERLTEQGPSAELPVANPLEGWRLRVFATPELETQLVGDLATPVWLAVAGISLALLLSGVLITAGLRREVKLAESRVSFVNQVSHELRTPLTNIRMYADLLSEQLRRDDAGDAQLERLDVIQNESRRLSRLINNVLEFARSSRKPKALRPSAAILDELITEILATFEPKLQELNFRIELDLQTPGLRRFDTDVVEQVLVNLIGNAEKYAASGGFLRVESCVSESDPATVEITVSDNGPGIPDRLRERIFTPFERVSNRLEDPAGTGIGLSISRELARKHGGDCHLLTNSTGGASFLFAFEAPLAAT